MEFQSASDAVMANHLLETSRLGKCAAFVPIQDTNAGWLFCFSQRSADAGSETIRAVPADRAKMLFL
jgi:hypothetical protein